MIGSLIKTARLARGLTLQQVANALDDLWQHVRPFLVNVITEVLADPHAWSGSADRELSPEDHEQRHG